MKKLEVGMRFPHLKAVFEYLGIIDRYGSSSPQSRKIIINEYCNWHREGRLTIVIDEVFAEKRHIYTRYSNEDLKDNMTTMFRNLGHIPSYSEFFDNTHISMQTYKSRLNLGSKPYGGLIEYYFGKNHRLEYENTLKEIQKEHGKEFGKMVLMYSNDSLETNFRYIFDSNYLKFGVYPSKDTFNKLSPINESTYRNRFGVGWLKICAMYGYDIDTSNKSERMAMELCKEILKYDYISQETWAWLLNDNNHHLFCDGYFEKLNLVIEFDGAMHRRKNVIINGIDVSKRQQINDRIKDKLLNIHGITVVRIDSRLKWQSIDGMTQILKEQLPNFFDCPIK